MSESDTPFHGGTEHADISPATDLNNPANWNFKDSSDDWTNTRRSDGGYSRSRDKPRHIRDDDDPDDYTGVESLSDLLREPEPIQHDEEADYPHMDDDFDYEDDFDYADDFDQDYDIDDDLDDLGITLPSGEEVSFDELKKGYLRQADYSRKSEANAQKASLLETQSDQIRATVDAFADLVVSHIPAPPDPALATLNPAAYQAQEMQRATMLENVEALVTLGEQAGSVRETMTTNDHNELVHSETNALISKFPDIADPQMRDEFFRDVFETAQVLGFSDEEALGATDHRLFLLAHYARKGMAAEQEAMSQRDIAREKVKNVPKVAPRRRAQGLSTSNREAMRRLEQTGSIHDAMKVDFV